jgi:glyceraldehyde-3-phosphate dehydrogenase (NADP+)
MKRGAPNDANRRPGLLIGGQWVPRAAGELPVVDPFTGREIARVPLGDERHIERALAAAADAFPTARRVAPYERADLLRRIAEGMAERRAEFAETIVAEAGKPVTYAKGEVERAIATFTLAAEEARRTAGEAVPLDAFAAGAGHFGLARRFPLGVIAGISPFNFPLNLVAHKVAPCLATGNTMVLKPAPKTPLSALMLGEVMVASGLPAGQVNIITCTNEAASRLITDARVKMISFTGSTEVGWKIKEQSGRRRVVLELGGNAGVIVHADADLGAAIPGIATAAFASAGQSCISVQRVFVQEKIYQDFKTRLIAHTREKITAGDPRKSTTVVGPMITTDALAKVRARIDAAVAGGARLLCGGGAKRQTLQATILENVDPAGELCAEEAFAPVLVLAKYRTFEEALALVNASRFGLQAGVFTRDISRAFQAYEALEVGGVMINQVPTWRVENMPYGGSKASGFGREGVRYAMEEMTELRTLGVRL